MNLTFHCRVILETTYLPDMQVCCYIFTERKIDSRIDILTLPEFRAWNSNEKYSNLWQTEHRKIFVLIQRRYLLYLQASCSDERLLSRAVICDGMDFSERKNFVREFVSVGNENHFLCPEVDSGVETIREGKDIYL